MRTRLLAIIPVIITVAVPPYQRAQMLARETAASKAVQTIQTGTVMYQSHTATSPRRCANSVLPTLAHRAPPQPG